MPDDHGRQAEHGDRDLGAASPQPGGLREDCPGTIDGHGEPLAGRLVGEPITRHAYPQTLSDAAFHQLVDGDPADQDPGHKPQDGGFTGPIQVGEAVWVILRASR